MNFYLTDSSGEKRRIESSCFLKKGKEILKIVVERDELALSPRAESGESADHMITFCRDYSIGDNHCYQDIDALWQDMLRREVSTDELIAHCRTASKTPEEWDTIRVLDNGAVEFYGYTSFFGEKHPAEWTQQEKFEDIDLEKQFIADCIIELAPASLCMRLLEGKVFWMPVYLMDHSGLSIRTTSFQDRWDSGCIGWVYMTKEEAVTAFAGTEEALLETKAIDYMTASVKEYD